MVATVDVDEDWASVGSLSHVTKSGSRPLQLIFRTCLSCILQAFSRPSCTCTTTTVADNPSQKGRPRPPHSCQRSPPSCLLPKLSRPTAAPNRSPRLPLLPPAPRRPQPLLALPSLPSRSSSLSMAAASPTRPCTMQSRTRSRQRLTVCRPGW